MGEELGIFGLTLGSIEERLKRIETHLGITGSTPMTAALEALLDDDIEGER